MDEFSPYIQHTKVQSKSHIGVWIGVKSRDQVPTADNTGETPSYSNWIPGEPSDGKGDTAAGRMRQGVCVAEIVWQSPEDHAVWPAFPGGWDDEDCDRPLLFACELRCCDQ